MAKQQVFYIHGGESYLDHGQFLERLRTRAIWDLPTEQQKTKWTQTLAADLGDEYEVFMPQMPNKQNASYEEWSIWFERHFEYLRDDVMLIGCSLGAMFLIKYLSEKTTPFRIKNLIIMAAPLPDQGLNLSDAGDFVCELGKVSILQERAKNIQIWQSKDDFLVPYRHAEVLAGLVPGSRLVMLEEKNHFLVPELPELVAEIKAVAGE